MSDTIGKKVQYVLSGPGLPSAVPYPGFYFLNTTDNLMYFSSTAPTPAWALLNQRRNYILNGGFQVWQRGTNFATLNRFTADRWQIISDAAGGTHTVSQQAFTPGQTDVPGEPAYFFRYARSASPTSVTYCQLRHQTEGVLDFANKTVTVSFWVRTTLANHAMTPFLTQFFGSSGSTQINVFASSTSNLPIPQVNTWVRATAIFNLPSLAGKTLTSNHGLFLQIRISGSETAPYTLDLANVQLEEGPVATPFVRKPFQEEYYQCMRYYQKSFAYETTPGNSVSWDGQVEYVLHASFNSNWYFPITFPVAFRANPSVVTIYTIPGIALANSVYNFSTGNATNTFSINTATTSGKRTSLVIPASGLGWSGGQNVNCCWEASAEIA
jgi:hypothetical protein